MTRRARLNFFSAMFLDWERKKKNKERENETDDKRAPNKQPNKQTRVL